MSENIEYYDFGFKESHRGSSDKETSKDYANFLQNNLAKKVKSKTKVDFDENVTGRNNADKIYAMRTNKSHDLISDSENSNFNGLSDFQKVKVFNKRPKQHSEHSAYGMESKQFNEYLEEISGHRSKDDFSAIDDHMKKVKDIGMSVGFNQVNIGNGSKDVHVAWDNDYSYPSVDTNDYNLLHQSNSKKQNKQAIIGSPNLAIVSSHGKIQAEPAQAINAYRNFQQKVGQRKMQQKHRSHLTDYDKHNEEGNC